MSSVREWTSRAVGRVSQETGADLRRSVSGAVSGPSRAPLVVVPVPVGAIPEHVCQWLGEHCDRPGTDTVRGVWLCRSHLFAALQRMAS